MLRTLPCWHPYHEGETQNIQWWLISDDLSQQ